MTTVSIGRAPILDPQRLVAAALAALLTLGTLGIAASCGDRPGTGGGGWQEQVRNAGGNPRHAYCTECHEWYDASNPGEVGRHAH